MTTDSEKAAQAENRGKTAETGRPADKNPSAPQKMSLTKKVLIGLVLLGISVLSWWFFHNRAKAKAAATSARGQTGPVPVVEGTVGTRDVPIYLDGLGTVQAFNTVTVHARVDGQLMKVAFTEGQEVKAGDLLAQLDPAPYQAALDQALAKKAQDEAQLPNARVDLQRYADLLKTEGTTQQTYDTQKALIAQLEAGVKADQAAIDSARVNLDYTTIRSPIDGRIGIRQVDAGNIVHASDANGLVVVTQLRPISVLFTLPEQVLSKLQDNQHAGSDYTVLAVSRDNTNTLGEGSLAVIDNQIDATTGTLKLKATFANENLRLWPGQFINTRLRLTTLTNGVTVPASVVQRGPDGAFAFVIQPDNTVQMRPIKVTQIEAGEALIASGLKPGEHVVVDGQYKLQPGSHVKPADSPAADGSAGAPSDAQKRQGKKP